MPVNRVASVAEAVEERCGTAKQDSGPIMLHSTSFEAAAVFGFLV